MTPRSTEELDLFDSLIKQNHLIEMSKDSSIDKQTWKQWIQKDWPDSVTKAISLSNYLCQQSFDIGLIGSSMRTIYFDVHSLSK